ncbi:MAG TPA: methanobactin export MATE transporter MbnM [Methylosinus sp.]
MAPFNEEFWRGYWPLLLTVGAVQLSQQVDILMVARVADGAPSAYLIIMRLAILDVVLTAAIGAVISTAVGQARSGGHGYTSHIIGQALGLALPAGLCCCALGLSLYPRVAPWLTSDNEILALVGPGAFWFSVAAPFRMWNSACTFILHASGRGALVVKWKFVEVGAKAAATFLAVEFFRCGFSSCFIAALFVAIASTIWCRRALWSSLGIDGLSLPDYASTTKFMRWTGWEAQRIMSIQLATLACLALFSARWLGNYDVSRVDSYAAGQTLTLMVLAPFMALVQFLAFRLAPIPDDFLESSVRILWRHGLPVAISAGYLLFLSCDQLGHLYGQCGPWWSTFIESLAISLPLRYTTNVMRAALQSRGGFAIVATLDSAAFWLLATPLVAIGLYLDSAPVAYLSLIVPEAVCAASLWGRIQTVPPFPRRL